MGKHKVKILPLDAIYIAEDGENILEFAMRSGVHINASCGGNSTCGKCRVRIIDGDLHSDEHPSVSEKEYRDGIRLACRTKITGDATIEIPLESQIDRATLKHRRAPKILTAPDAMKTVGEILPDPVVSRYYVELNPPDLNDNMADFERLSKALMERHNLKDITAELYILKKLPMILRDSDWKVTVTISETKKGCEIIDIHQGGAAQRQYCFAVDIGTTTICSQLIEISGDKEKTARVLAESADYNAQISYGEDVISRIMYSRKKGGLKRLQEAVADTVNRLIDELIKNSGIDLSCISHLTFAGNTTMTQLAIGIEPKYIMISPYTPTFVFPPILKASDIGIRLPGHTPVFCLPCVASYVGGDIVAGVMGSGMAMDKNISLFIDIGTNGEIVLGNKDWLICASCSAGPAFEGGGIRFGMRAGRGAIEQVRINPATYEPMILTVGNSKPMGICGSGLIDCVAEMLRAGIISQKGKYNRDLPTKRIREGTDGYEYVLCYEKETEIRKDICLTEIDLDNLIRAKAAMFAGCKVLVDSVGISFNDIEKIIIAGGFGHYIDPVKAQTIGLLPELPVKRFVFIGNGSLLGASLYAISKKSVKETNRIAKMMTNLELSNNNRFMDEFMAAMFLPHTDSRIFPETFRGIGKKHNS